MTALLTYAGYATCSHCTFPFYQARPDATLCPLCDNNMVKPKIAEAKRKEAEAPVCRVCHKVMHGEPSNKRTCSPECKREHANRLQRLAETPRICDWCKGPYMSGDSRVVTCSEACKRSYRLNRQAEWRKQRKEQEVAA